MTEKKCFIIMPVSTPVDSVNIYSGDEYHFKHVLEYLFIPAIRQVGMIPIEPIVRGSEVIHAEVIKNIESADFILCDMSTLNANVFFELGIRTAINKPVALVKDDLTLKVPFDTNLINNHTYLHSLNAWELDPEIKKLTEHLENCCGSTVVDNSLWRYFGLSASITPLEKPVKSEDKIDYLTMEVQALRREMEKSINVETLEPTAYWTRKGSEISELYNDLRRFTSRRGFDVGGFSGEGQTVRITTSIDITEDVKLAMKNIASARGFNLSINESLPQREQGKKAKYE